MSLITLNFIDYSNKIIINWPIFIFKNFIKYFYIYTLIKLNFLKKILLKLKNSIKHGHLRGLQQIFKKHQLTYRQTQFRSLYKTTTDQR